MSSVELVHTEFVCVDFVYSLPLMLLLHALSVDHPLHILGDASDEQQAAWEHSGFEQIARGRVAAVLIATAAADSAAAATAGAADGTPRVALAVAGLPSGKSVLQLLAERILRLQRLAATSSFGKNAPVSRQINW